MQTSQRGAAVGFVVTRFHQGITWVLTGERSPDSGRYLWSNMSDDSRIFGNKGLATIASNASDSSYRCEHWEAPPIVMKHSEYLDLFIDECVDHTWSDTLVDMLNEDPADIFARIESMSDEELNAQHDLDMKDPAFREWANECSDDEDRQWYVDNGYLT
jgi:hypothetical protein